MGLTNMAQKGYWRQGDGTMILIAEMTDSHLSNCIEFTEEKIAESKNDIELHQMELTLTNLTYDDIKKIRTNIRVHFWNLSKWRSKHSQLMLESKQRREPDVVKLKKESTFGQIPGLVPGLTFEGVAPHPKAMKNLKFLRYRNIAHEAIDKVTEYDRHVLGKFEPNEIKCRPFAAASVVGKNVIEATIKVPKGVRVRIKIVE